MATKFAAREVLVLATEDDCSGRSNSENRERIDGVIQSCEYVLNYKASRYRYVFIFLNIFSTAGRSIRHSGGCDSERGKATIIRGYLI